MKINNDRKGTHLIRSQNWIGWNYKSRTDEIIELVLDEVNDMLKKSKIKINYQYNDDNEEGWDYFLELTKEYNGKEI